MLRIMSKHEHAARNNSIEAHGQAGDVPPGKGGSRAPRKATGGCRGGRGGHAGAAAGDKAAAPKPRRARAAQALAQIFFQQAAAQSAGAPDIDAAVPGAGFLEFDVSFQRDHLRAGVRFLGRPLLPAA